MKHVLPMLAVATLTAISAAAQTPAAPQILPAPDMDGYPTTARAEYVFACMNTNGGTQEALRQCSCAIDVIASIVPYRSYEQAETVLRMRRGTSGYLAQEFRVPIANDMVKVLQQAQAEAEVSCF